MSIRPVHEFCYRATVVRVIDADTIVLDIDLGCEVWRRNEHCRLYGIDAPEVRGVERPEGLLAKQWLSERIEPGEQVLIRTHKDRRGKYGRWLIEIWAGNNTASLNAQLVAAGHAERAGS